MLGIELGISLSQLYLTSLRMDYTGRPFFKKHLKTKESKKNHILQHLYQGSYRRDGACGRFGVRITAETDPL